MDENKSYHGGKVAHHAPHSFGEAEAAMTNNQGEKVPLNQEKNPFDSQLNLLDDKSVELGQLSAPFSSHQQSAKTQKKSKDNNFPQTQKSVGQNLKGAKIYKSDQNPFMRVEDREEPNEDELKHYLLDQKDDCKEYLKKVSYPIKISELLYEIVGSSFENQCGEFCPVLLKIKDYHTCIEINKKLRENEWTHECQNENDHECEIDKKDGKCVSERPMKEYLLQLWNSQDKLIYERLTDCKVELMMATELPNFKEDGLPNIFAFIEKEKDVDEATCFILFVDPDADLKPYLFNFTLSDKGMDVKEFYQEHVQTKKEGKMTTEKEKRFIGFSNGSLVLANSYQLWYMDLRPFIKARENKKFTDYYNKKYPAIKTSKESINSEQEQTKKGVQRIPKGQIYEEFEKQFGTCLLGATDYKKKIDLLLEKGSSQDRRSQLWTKQELSWKGKGNVKDEASSKEQREYTRKIVAIDDIGCGDCSMVLEDALTHYLIYMRLELPDADNEKQNTFVLHKIEDCFSTGWSQRKDYLEKELASQSELIAELTDIARSQKANGIATGADTELQRYLTEKTQLEGQLASCVSRKPLQQIKSVVARVNDTYNNKDLMHFAVTRRCEGMIDLYCNFIKVSTVNIKGQAIIDFNIDFNKIYFTTVPEAEVKKHEDKDKEYYTIELSQQRLIGQTTYKKISKPYDSAIIYHQRLAGHFKLYSHILSYKTFIVIAHRNFISTLDLSHKQGSTNALQTISFSDKVTDMAIMATTNKLEQTWADFRQMRPTPINTTKRLTESKPDEVAQPYLLIIVGYRQMEFLTPDDNSFTQVNFNVVYNKQPNTVDLSNAKKSGNKTPEQIANARREEKRKTEEWEVPENALKIITPPIQSILLDESRKRARELYFLIKDDSDPGQLPAIVEPLQDTCYINIGCDVFQNSKKVKEAEEGKVQLVCFDGTFFEMKGGQKLDKDSTASIYRHRNVALDEEDNWQDTIFLVFGVDKPGQPSDYIEFKQIKETRKKQNEFGTTVGIEEYKTDEQTHTCSLKEHSQEDKSKENTKVMTGASKKDAERSKMLAIYKILKDGGAEKDLKTDFQILEVRTEGIIVCDSEGEKVNELSNLSIVNCHYSDNKYLYIMQNASNGEVESSCQTSKTTERDYDLKYKSAGIYVYDVHEMSKGSKWVQGVKVAGALSGAADHLVFSTYCHRFAYVQDFQYIMFMPMVHRNTLKFIGMESKKDYRVWRTYDGKFTALHKSGYMRTWSLATGQVLYNKYLLKECKKKNHMYEEEANVQAQVLDKFKIEQRDSTVFSQKNIQPDQRASEDLAAKLRQSEIYFTCQMESENTDLLCEDRVHSKSEGYLKCDCCPNYFICLECANRPIPTEHTPVGKEMRIIDMPDEDFSWLKNYDVYSCDQRQKKTFGKAPQEDDIYREEEYNLEDASYALISKPIRSVLQHQVRKGIKNRMKEKLKLERVEKNKSLYKSNLSHYVQEDEISVQVNNMSLDSEPAIMAKQAERKEKKIDSMLLNSVSQLPERKEDLDDDNDIFVGVKQKGDYQKVKRHNFRVLKMFQQINQRKLLSDEKQSGVNVVVDFQFNFDVYQPPPKKKGQYFDANYDSQKLYLSEDMTKLLEIVYAKGQATVYRRQDIPNKEGTTPEEREKITKTKFNKWRTVQSYPQMLDKRSGKNTLFSPNFDYMLNCDTKKDVFFIYNVEKQRTEVEIPNDLLSQRLGDLKQITQGSIELIASRMRLLDNRRIRILNTDNLDCILDFTTAELKSYVKVDNMQADHYDKHFIADRDHYPIDEVGVRLIRKSQEHKTWVHHGVELSPHTSMGKPQVNAHTIMSKTNTVDYSEDWNDDLSTFISEQPFTMLDWILTSKILKGSQKYSIDLVPQQTKVQLAFNIFPGGQSFFHKILRKVQNLKKQWSRNKETGKRGDYFVKDKSKKRVYNFEQLMIANEDTMTAIFQAMEGEVDMANNGKEGFAFNRLEVPITKDIYGLTALDVILGVKLDEDDQDRAVYPWPGFFQVIPDEYENLMGDTATHMPVSYANEIFKNIMNYSFMHCGPDISAAVVEAVRKRVPCIYDFLDARFQKPNHYPRVKNKLLKKDIQESRVKQDQDAANPNRFMPLKYAAQPMEPWSKHSVIKDYFFGEDNDVGGQEVKMTFFDIPNLHSYSKDGTEFMYVLYAASEEDAKVCDHESVNMLINEHWRYCQIYFHMFQTLPYLLVQAVLSFWSYSIGPFGPESEASKKGVMVAAYVIIVYGTYILYVELATFRRYNWNFRKYISERGIWTYINWINSLTLWTQGLFVIVGSEDYQFFWTIYTYSVMFIWFKSVYFLKSIPKLGWMIKMIETAMISAIPFLAILVVTILAFSEAFLANSKNNVVTYGGKGDFFGQHTKSYAEGLRHGYLNMLGEFENIDDYDASGWILFVLATVLNMIIMFNMLVTLFLKTLDKYYDARFMHVPATTITLVYDVHDILHSSFMPYAKDDKCMFHIQELSSFDDAEEETKVDFPIVQPSLDLILKSIADLSAKQETTNDNLKREAATSSRIKRYIANMNNQSQKGMAGSVLNKVEQKKRELINQDNQSAFSNSRFGSTSHMRANSLMTGDKDDGNSRQRTIGQ